MKKYNKKGNMIVVTLFILIIVVALSVAILLYFDIDSNDIQSKINGKPSYDFNYESTIFIGQDTLNKLNYVYNELSNDSLLCVYGINKPNGDLFIDDIKMLETNDKCFDNNKYLGYLYTKKNNKINVYDIDCALDETQVIEINNDENKLTTIMCKENWFGFYNINNIDKSYNYQITN